jgi:hypothetical protein
MRHHEWFDNQRWRSFDRSNMAHSRIMATVLWKVIRVFSLPLRGTELAVD